MAWKVYDKTGNTVRCTLKSLEYNGTWMGACFVTSTLKSAVPILFEIGDYVMYRGEKFEINYDPTALKKAARKTSGEAFVYDNVKFNWPGDELTRCDFLDYVKSDNQIHFTSLPKFSFFASSIQDLADRVQVNLDRIYTGAQKWTVVVHPEYVSTTNVNIDVNNIKVWGALPVLLWAIFSSMDVETVCTKFNVQPMRINRLLPGCVHTVVQEICLTGIIISSQTVLLPIICRITWPWKI